jgi:hypothetical protein
MAREILEYLTAWLRHHILVQDMVYKPYVADSEACDQLAGITFAPLADPDRPVTCEVPA